MSDMEMNHDKPSTEGTANVIYILNLVGIVVGLASLVGLIMAYVNRPAAPAWLQTHYQFQIRTFWIGLLYSAIGVLLAIVLIGYLVLLFTLVWWIIRMVKGMQALSARQPVANPTSWMF